MQADLETQKDRPWTLSPCNGFSQTTQLKVCEDDESGVEWGSVPKAGPSPRLTTPSFDSSVAAEQLHSSDLLEHSVRNTTMVFLPTTSTSQWKLNTLFPLDLKGRAHVWGIAAMLCNYKRTIKWDTMSFCCQCVFVFPPAAGTVFQRPCQHIPRTNTNLQTHCSQLINVPSDVWMEPGSCRREIIFLRYGTITLCHNHWNSKFITYTWS